MHKKYRFPIKYKVIKKYFLVALTVVFFINVGHLYVYAKESSRVHNSDYAIHKYPENLKDFSVSHLVQNLQKSVVNILATHIEKGQENPVHLEKPEFDDDSKKTSKNQSDFQEYFDEFFDNSEKNRNFYRQNFWGSGFIVDAKKGYILTNNHVINDADIIEVIFSDGEKTQARCVGVDQKTDIALLKIDPKAHPLQEVKFADSEKAQIGDWVLAIGNPYGFGGSVTIGIISARNRNIHFGLYNDFIQTDAAINRGNSGGPLFDMDGQVVGMNTAIISPTGGSIGLGFAIPSQIVIPILEQLKKYGQVHRGSLGLRIQSVTPILAQLKHLKDLKGALVSGKINAEGVENKALEIGDIIISFDGKDVKNAIDLTKLISETEIGKKIKVTVLRQGQNQILQKQDVFVKLGNIKNEQINKSEENAGIASKNTSEKVDKTINLLNICQMLPLTEAMRAKYHITKDLKGLVFTSIVKNSILDKKQVKIGDVLVKLNQEDVTSLVDVKRILQQLLTQGRGYALMLVSKPNKDLRFIAVPINN